MNGDSQELVCGIVDGAGRLVSADPRLLALQLKAGGEASGELAVPQLASLVRMARTLGVLVSRAVTAADGDVTLSLWVRAQPEAGQVRLTIAGWRELAAVEPDAATQDRRSRLVTQLDGDGRWQTDAALRLVSLSDDAGHLGVSDTRPLIGRRMTEALRLIDGQAGSLALLEGVVEGRPFVGQVAEWRARPELRLALSGEPLRDADGKLTGYGGGWRWIDAPLSRSVVAAAADPGDALEARLEPAMRAPLNRIIAEADAINAQTSGPLNPQYAEYAQDIASAGRHLLGLVDDLSDLQAVERPGFVVPVEANDLSDIARRAAGLLAVRASSRQVKIDAPDVDEPLIARCDFRRTLQILVNLIGNAVRYSPPGGMVWVRAEREGDLVALIVADMGKGIATEDQERIFERFERVDPNEPGGNGLGLYISRRLARAMGGDIGVDSAPGQGARFILTLNAAG
jgi:signal transduction histidine kinase